jgi:hypothetical protein
MNRKWKISISVALALALLGLGGVWAAEAGRAADGQCARGKGHRNAVMGRITAIDGDKVTVKPELPAWVSSKLAEKGIAAPADTKAFKNSAAASTSDFAVGDSIAARLDGDPASGTAHAKRMADDATVQALMQKFKERRETRREKRQASGDAALTNWNGQQHSGLIFAANNGDGEVKGEAKQRGEGKGQRGEGKRQRGEGGGPGEGGHRARPAYGKITAISGNTITIEPRRPEWAKQPPGGGEGREGREQPPMPESITFTVNAETKYGVNGEKGGSLSDFAVGDIIGARLEGDVRSGAGVALAVMDDQTSKKLFEQMGKGARGEGGGPGGRDGRPGGQGGPGGPGGPGRGEGRERGPRPMFGVITSVDGNNITIKPEVPEFVKQHMAQRGGPGGEGGPRGEGGPGGQGGPRGEGGPGGGGPGGKGGPGGEGGQRGERGPRELPAQLTVSLGGDTHYFQNNTEVDRNPYRAGDSVAIMLAEGSTREDATAHAVMDYSTFQAKARQMRDGAKGKGGKEGKAGKGKAGKGKTRGGKDKQKEGQTA